MHKEVYKIFVEMFDKDIAGKKERYGKLAEEIYIFCVKNSLGLEIYHTKPK